MALGRFDMRPFQLHECTVADIRRACVSKQVSARELVQAYVDRIGALHGVPVVVKDQIASAGMPTTLGSTLFRNYRPERDAFVVGKLR